jgi:methionine-rich copper-binding protein CopC
MFAMNLALQTRRAVITLGLMALALVCVAAKTATRHDALSSEAPVRMENMAVQASAAPVAVKVVAKAKACAKVEIVRI